MRKRSESGSGGVGIGVGLWNLEDNRAGFEGAAHIDDALVAAAAKKEGFIAERLDKGTIDEHVDLAQEGFLARVGKDLLESEAGVAPDGFGRSGADCAGEFGKSFGLEHRVAAAESNIGKRVGEDNVENFGNRGRCAGINVPRLRVVASGTMIGTAGGIDGGPETRTVHRRIFNNS